MAMEIINREHCTPFITKDGSTIRELLAHRNSAIRKQSLAEATVPVGIRTQLHHHLETEEIYYVLRGTGVITIEDLTRAIGPADAIAIPPGKRHCIENTGAEDLVFLCCCAPGYEHADTLIADSI
jgi:mannose-6-phosphate isomerase-like protein (cupin superfamily)